MALSHYSMETDGGLLHTPQYEDNTTYYDNNMTYYEENMTEFGMWDNSTVGPGNETETEATCLLFRFTLYVCVMGVLCVLGFIGNTVNFLVLGRDRSTPVASFLLQVLAVADNLMLFFWANHFIFGYFMEFIGVPWMELPRFMWLYRVYSYPFLFIAQTETIWLTVVIALNRYMAVCLPYRAPHLCTITNVYKEVVTVTAFSILYNLPRFFVMEVPHKYTENGTVNQNSSHFYIYNDFGKSEGYRLVYMHTLYYLVSFVLPLLILAFVNTRVTIAYQAARKRRRRMTSRRTENENNITLVMIIVVLTFMLCQAPARIVQLVWEYKYQHCIKYQVKYYLIHLSNTLEALNSSINFGIYFCFRKRFRDILWQNYCWGPLASKHRRDSGRPTTTEGLSLEEMRQTSSRKSSSQKSKSSGKDSQKNGCIISKSGASSSTPAQENQSAELSDAKPLETKVEAEAEQQPKTCRDNTYTHPVQETEDDLGDEDEGLKEKDDVLEALV